MPSAPSPAICFRCDWAGPDPGTPCPRCDADLYVSESPPTPSSPPPEGSPRTSGERPRRGRPRPVLEARVTGAPRRAEDAAHPAWGRGALWWALGLVVASAIAVASIFGRPAPDTDRVAGDVDRAATPAGARSVALPSALSDATSAQPVSVTFVTRDSLGDQRGPVFLFRLWKLDLPHGTLVPGPVVADDVQAIRADPRPGVQRLAFLVRGGGLFILDGFLGARPNWVAGGVDSFDFDVTGALTFARVRRETVGEGIKVAVTVERVPPSGTSVGSPLVRTLRFDRLAGAGVRGGHGVAWGVRDGEYVVVKLTPSGSPAVRESRLGDLRPVDLSPGANLILGRGPEPLEWTYLMAPSSHEVPVSFPLTLDRAVSWSRDGTLLTAIGADGADHGMWLLGTRGRRMTFFGPPPPAPRNSVAFTPSGVLFVWAEADGLMFANIAGRRFPVSLSGPVPRLAGPIAVG